MDMNLPYEYGSGYIDNGISLDLVNLEDKYNSMPGNVVVVNDVARKFEIGRATEVINDLIRTHYSEDELSTVPSCKCGRLAGNFNLGEFCDAEDCNTYVERVVDKPLESQVWMRVPDGIPAFVHPRFWGLFSNYFTSKKFDLLEWLTNPTYIPGKGTEGGSTREDAKVAPIIEALEAAGIKRGLRFFYENFDRIMEVVLQPKPFLAHKSERMALKVALCDKWRLFIEEYRDCIFTAYMPFPSKLVMVSEQGGNMGYIDKNMPPAFDAIKIIAGVENSILELSMEKIESRVIKATKLLVQYYTGFRQNVCGKKPGMYRRQLGSTRSPFTGRAVISPISGPHEYDEVFAPWSWSIVLLRVHLSNKLLRREFSPYELFRFIDRVTLNSRGPDGDYMEELLSVLINECPEGGVPIGMLRNPTLERLSDQPFRITRINRNTNVNAIQMSVLCIKGPNADFDGDQLQVKLLLDNKEKAQFARLASHLGIMDTDSPRTIKKIVTMHPELITMAGNFLSRYRVANKDVA